MRLVAIPPAIPEDAPRPPDDSLARRSLQGETMGTVWRADFFAARAGGDERWVAAIEEDLERLVGQMSHWREDSDLSRFNRARTGEWIALPEEFYAVLSAALAVARETGGAFDPAIGAAVDAWGFGPGGREAATDDPPVPSVHWRGIELDAANRRARQPGGAQLDLSAIAKGYAVDRLAALLHGEGAACHLVEIGGELRGAGVKPDGQPWWVAIERPPDSGPQQFPETVIALCGLSAATSGDYRRYFEIDGTRYAHTIDPRTGRPVRHAVASVTVLHRECTFADAYSTALMAMGPDEGIAFADTRALAALLVLRGDSGFEIRTSATFREMLG